MNDVLTIAETTRREIDSLEDAARVARVVRENGHVCIAPTHVFERGDDVVGYASVNAVPVLTGWLDEDKVEQAEARALVAGLEDMARERGLAFVCMPCTADCRFKPDMEKMGYRLAGKVSLYLKGL